MWLSAKPRQPPSGGCADDEDRRIHGLRGGGAGSRHRLDPLQHARTTERFHAGDQAGPHRDDPPGADGPRRPRAGHHRRRARLLRGGRHFRAGQGDWRRRAHGAHPAWPRQPHRHLRGPAPPLADGEPGPAQLRQDCHRRHQRRGDPDRYDPGPRVRLPHRRAKRAHRERHAALWPAAGRRRPIPLRAADGRCEDDGLLHQQAHRGRGGSP